MGGCVSKSSKEKDADKAPYGAGKDKDTEEAPAVKTEAAPAVKTEVPPAKEEKPASATDGDKQAKVAEPPKVSAVRGVYIRIGRIVLTLL